MVENESQPCPLIRCAPQQFTLHQTGATSSFVRYADDVRLSSRTPSGARHALTRIAEVLQALGLRLSERKTKLVTAYQGWISWGTG